MARKLRVLAQPAFSNVRSNPYQFLLYDAIRSLGKAEIVEYKAGRPIFEKIDIWHIHWPDLFLGTDRAGRAALSLLKCSIEWEIARKKGTQIVWTVHNLSSHEKKHKKIEKMLWSQWSKQVDASISLSKSGETVALNEFPWLASRRRFVIPHGHYRGYYPNTIKREIARNSLGYSDSNFVIGFVGQIRPYKNVLGLIKAFKALENSNLRLLIAGRCQSPRLSEEIGSESAADDRIIFINEFIPDEKLQAYFGASDLVALPFSEILNSGSVLLSLSFNKPVLVPASGAMIELSRELGRQWVRLYHGELSARILLDAISRTSGRMYQEEAPIKQLDWSVIGAKTMDAYMEIVGAQ